MITIPWEGISEVFVNMMITLAPVGMTISLGVFVWRMWLKVTGLK